MFVYQSSYPFIDPCREIHYLNLVHPKCWFNMRCSLLVNCNLSGRIMKL